MQTKQEAHAVVVVYLDLSLTETGHAVTRELVTDARKAAERGNIDMACEGIRRALLALPDWESGVSTSGCRRLLLLSQDFATRAQRTAFWAAKRAQRAKDGAS